MLFVDCNSMEKLKMYLFINYCIIHEHPPKNSKIKLSSPPLSILSKLATYETQTSEFCGAFYILQLIKVVL